MCIEQELLKGELTTEFSWCVFVAYEPMLHHVVPNALMYEYLNNSCIVLCISILHNFHAIFLFPCPEFSFTGLRRSEVRSVRQLKKANSTNKHNALLFTAAKNKGVLMFKKC